MVTHTHTHTYIHTYTHIYTHTYIYTYTHTHIHIHTQNRNIWPTANQYKHMAQRHAHSQPIETYGLAPRAQPTNRNIWPSAANRNIWPYNSQATAAPSRLADSFVCFDIGSIPTRNLSHCIDSL